jgi:hypothetical protein
MGFYKNVKLPVINPQQVTSGITSSMDELMKDVPVELEIQLRKKQSKKRRFTPNTSITRRNIKRKKQI